MPDYLYLFTSPSAVVSIHSSALVSLLDAGDLIPSLRMCHLNALKMNCYVLAHLIEAFEIESGQSSLVRLDTKRKVKKESSCKLILLEMDFYPCR